MYLKPSRRSKTRIRKKIFIIAAIAAAAAVGIFLLIHFFPRLSVGSGPLVETGRAIPETATASKNGILYADGGAIVLVDFNGEEKWNLPVDMQAPELASSETLICAYTSKSMELMDYDKQQLFGASFDSTIQDAACGVDHVALLTSSAPAPEETGTEEASGEEATAASFKQVIYLFDRENNPTGQIEFTSKEVVDFGFSGDTDSLWVLTLDTTGIVPASYIATYKSDAMQVGTIEINTQIVEQVYMTDFLTFASGTNSLVSYTKASQKENEALFYGWSPHAVYHTNEEITFACAPIGGGNYIPMVRLYFTDLSERTISLPRNVLSLAVTGTKLYAFATEEVYVYNTEDGSLSRSDKTNVTISSAKQISNDYALVWDVQKKAYIMKLS